MPNQPLSPIGAPVAPLPLPSPQTSTPLTNFGQQRLFPSRLALPFSGRQSTTSGAYPQQQSATFQSTFGSSSEANMMSNHIPGPSSQLAAPVNNTQLTPSIPAAANPPKVSTEEMKQTQPHTETNANPKAKHSTQAEEPLARIPAMTPSPTPVHSAPKSATHTPPRAGKSSTSTFFPGVPRTASPAHPRMFVKDGQERFAVHKFAQSPQQNKAPVAGKAGQIFSTEKSARQTLDIFGE